MYVVQELKSIAGFFTMACHGTNSISKVAHINTHVHCREVWIKICMTWIKNITKPSQSHLKFKTTMSPKSSCNSNQQSMGRHESTFAFKVIVCWCRSLSSQSLALAYFLSPFEAKKVLYSAYWWLLYQNCPIMILTQSTPKDCNLTTTYIMISIALWWLTQEPQKILICWVHITWLNRGHLAPVCGGTLTQ